MLSFSNEKQNVQPLIKGIKLSSANATGSEGPTKLGWEIFSRFTKTMHEIFFLGILLLGTLTMNKKKMKRMFFTYIR